MNVSLFAELKRRNVIRVAIAYAAVGWLVLGASPSAMRQSMEAQSSINIAPTFPLIQFIATAGTNNVTSPSALSPQARRAISCG